VLSSISILYRWALTQPNPNILLNKRLTRVLFDPTQRDFFDPKEKKLKILGFLREIFQTLAQTKDG